MATSAHPAAELPEAMISTLTPAGDWVIVLPLVLALMGAALLLMTRHAKNYHAGIAMVIVGAIIACDGVLLAHVLQNGPVSMTMGKWLPPFGISFTADIFGAGFALIAAMVTMLLLVYSQSERHADFGLDGYYALILLLLAGVTGSFLTGDLFNLYVWFEVMLISSFGLIVNGGKAIQLDGALKYAFLNFLATTFFLLALGLIYGLLGTLNMADIIGAAPHANSAAMVGVATLMLLAFGMKAAAFPLNAWLPASYHTPPAVVSALFAGLLTKVGIYALLRVLVLLLPDSRDTLEPVLVVIAVLTLVISPLGAIAETNLRRAMGFIVMGGIGVILAGIALPSQNGVAGSGVYIVHSMMVMTALYLVAGLVEKVTGQTDSRQMGGVYAANSVVSALFLLLVLAAAGVPPFLGFWPKLLLLQAGMDAASGTTAGMPPDYYGIAIIVALLLNAFFTLIAGTRLWAHIFWRAGVEGENSEHSLAPVEPLGRRDSRLALWPCVVLVAAIMIVGLAPNYLLDAAQRGARDLIDPARYVAAVGLAGNSP
ncbi:proton-conducting transporter membrane subunit [Devosia rhodophyticola]|uniref:Proton-conducting transporter membrane subunit n=1 Tax=Devosia rhodophyticola TaxID=3026423 RepID=A0ABY7Z083_9HYPH|nr:proton-conducting transporter membrane subunit [Devosia rhodophyticola]WDR06435.1 proton-conducting transporter membrane subunit [Devosia rhodophyticola]